MHILIDIVYPHILGAELILHNILHGLDGLAVIIISSNGDCLESVVELYYPGLVAVFLQHGIHLLRITLYPQPQLWPAPIQGP